MTSPIVFLLDVDNTLLDNDAVIADIDRQLGCEFGETSRQRYWEIFDQLREESGYVDYLGALQRFRIEAETDPGLAMMSSFLLEYPFTRHLYPQALELLNHLRKWGETVIVTDGDIVYQPRKIQRSGLWNAVDGRVLIYRHKEYMLKDIALRFPAHHYVMVDDKLQILSAMKAVWKNQLTTVFVRQGHYALNPNTIAAYPAADMSIQTIADLIQIDFSDR
jgi:FMN phosphatase YigB (HAD superfamily)